MNGGRPGSWSLGCGRDVRIGSPKGLRKKLAYSRRDFFKGLLKPDVRKKPRNRVALPDGIDIMLDKDTCTAWGKGICTLCKDVCEEHAILFVGILNPRVLTSRCTLCGDCVPVCPTRAIVVREQEKTSGDVE